MKALFLSIIIFVTACSPKPAVTPVFSDPGAMNLLVISLDTLRQDRLGAFGYPRSTSPFLDRLAGQSIVFSDLSSQSSNTITSHRAIFTSKYPYTFTRGPIDPHISLAGVMRAGGWETAAFVDGGKMHHSFGNSPGFSLYDDTGGGFAVILPKARAWLTAPDRRKFFLFLHTYDIHSPYTPPAPYDRLLTDFNPPPISLAGKHPPLLTAMTLTRDQVRYISDQYDGGIRSCDASLATFFAFLRDQHLLDTTVVAIVSDHGESLGERGLFGHRRLYTVQLTVPQLLRIPGMPPRIVPDPIENIDLMPTILSIFHRPPPRTVQGKNLLPLLTGGHGGIAPDRLHLSETTNKAVREPGGWKYIMRERPADDELYYLPDDPEERRNRMTGDPGQAERLQEKLVALTGLTPEKLRVPHREAHPIDMANPGRNKLKDQLEVLGYLN